MQQNFKILELQDFVAKSTRTWHKTDTWYAKNRARVLKEAKARNAAKRNADDWLSQQVTPQWRRLHAAARTRANKKGLPFELTHAWVKDRLAVGRCEVTGVEFQSAANGRPVAYSASIDRIDNSKGYTPENSRMVIWAFNRMKGDMSDDETFAIASLVAGAAPTV